MTNTKVSDLPAVVTPAGTDEFPVAQSGASKKMTLAQVKTYATADLGTAAAADTGDFEAAGAVAAHAAVTTSVHGITDTSALLTTTAAAAAYQPLDSDLTSIAALTTT